MMLNVRYSNESNLFTFHHKRCFLLFRVYGDLLYFAEKNFILMGFNMGCYIPLIKDV